MKSEIVGHCLLPGSASGTVLFTDVPLSFWMGVDTTSGVIIDRHHPLRGETVAGRVVVMPSGRGSCAGSCGILELIVNGMAPAALVFEHADAILTLGAIIADEMFGTTIPVVSVGAARFAELRHSEDVTVTSIAGQPPGGELQLNRKDRTMLAGADGLATQTAMRIIVRLATAQGATALIDVEQAHIDGCFYTGPAGLKFAETLADWGGRVKVPSTTNAASVDAKRWRAQGIDPELGEAATRVGDAYVRMGVRPTFTCAPYLLDSAPVAGQQIAWGESNAVAFANSVLGARTMKYPDFADICVALTGRAAAIDAHLDLGRLATIAIDVEDLGTVDDSFYPLLGYHVGAMAGYEIPVITGLEHTNPTLDDLKAFSAAFATTSAAPMFHIVGVTPEAPTLAKASRDEGPLPTMVVTRADLLQSWHELDSATDVSVDLVSLGNPHFSLTEIAATVELCRNRSKDSRVAMIITCGRDVHGAAERAGHIAALEAFGAQVLNDTCWCMIDEPVMPADTRTLITNSAKYAHYGPGTTGRRFRFASLAACVEAACTGRAPDGVPAWLGPA